MPLGVLSLRRPRFRAVQAHPADSVFVLAGIKMFGSMCTRGRAVNVAARARSLRQPPTFMRRGKPRKVRPQNLHGGPPRANSQACSASAASRLQLGWLAVHGAPFFEPVAARSRSAPTADFLRRGFVIAKDIPA